MLFITSSLYNSLIINNLKMRTFGKNDFKNFEYISDDYLGTYISFFSYFQLGKFYNATSVDQDTKHSIYLLEASNLPAALNILSEAFLYNGTKHRNILNFQGAYLNEV